MLKGHFYSDFYYLEWHCKYVLLVDNMNMVDVCGMVTESYFVFNLKAAPYRYPLALELMKCSVFIDSTVLFNYRKQRLIYFSINTCGLSCVTLQLELGMKQ